MIEIIKIDRTDIDVDNTAYIAKIPYEVKDEYGTTATLYKKEYLNKVALETEKTNLQNQIIVIDEKLDALNTL